MQLALGISWLGGSETTYNYNGFTYNGTGGVVATGKNIYYNPTDYTMSYREIHGTSISMDLRGIANIGNTLYLIGGMINNQEVTDRVYRLNYFQVDINKVQSSSISIFQNPANDYVQIKGLKASNLSFKVNFSSSGKLILSGHLKTDETRVNVQSLPTGYYIIEITGSNMNVIKKINKK